MLRLAVCICVLLVEFPTLLHWAEDPDFAELMFHVFQEVCLAAIHRNMLHKAAVTAQCRQYPTSTLVKNLLADECVNL